MKQITVLIDEDGNSSVDLAGFTDNGCSAVMKDFQGDDHVLKEHKKPEYHQTAQKNIDERQHQRR